MSCAPSVVEGRRRTFHRQFSADRNVYIAHTIKCNAFQGSVTMSDADEELEKFGPGMLTDTQRHYLAGDLDVESGSQRERTIRSRIRERVTNTISDLIIFHRHAEMRDIEQISKEVKLGTLEAGEILGLLLRLNANISPFLKDNDIDPDSNIKPSPFVDQTAPDEMGLETKQEEAEELLNLFEDIINPGIHQAFRKQGFDIKDFTVNMDITLGDDLDSLAEQDLESLDEKSLMLLHQEDKISKEAFYSEAARRDMFKHGQKEYDAGRWKRDE